jgi:AraC-like DNA-binding protein
MSEKIKLYNKKFNLEKGWETLLKNFDISIQDVLLHARLPLDLLLQKTPLVSANEYYRFWDGLTFVSQDKPALALQLAKTISANVISPPIIAFLSSSDLTIALKRIAHYKPIVAPVRMSVKQNNKQTTLTFSGLSQDHPMPKLLIAFELVLWIELTRIATREQINPLSVYTNLNLPDQQAYEGFLNTPIKHANINSVTFSTKDAQKPFLTSNHEIWNILEPTFNKRMHELTQNASFRDKVKACLLESLASANYSMTYIASQLALSGRTMQRRLKSEETTFQKVLNEVRQELACHYLCKTDYTSADISFLLGYDEPNSFFRVFRKWTDTTPEVFRAKSLTHRKSFKLETHSPVAKLKTT